MRGPEQAAQPGLPSASGSPQQGGSFNVMELVWYGASKDQRLYYELDRYVYEPQRSQEFIDASMPIQRSVQWKYR